MKIFTLIAVFAVITCNAAVTLKPFIIQPAPVKAKFDGKIDEWNGSRKITLNRWNWRVKPEKQVVYGGDDDIFATVNIGWKKGYIIISAFIADDSWHPGSKAKPAEGDALIILIAPSNPINTPAAAPYEIVISGNPIMTYIKISDSKYQEIPNALLSYARAHSVINTETANIEEGKKPDEFLTKCWIEAAIPATELPGVSLPYGNINFGIIVRDNDGNGVRGELRWRGNNGELKSADGLAVGKFFVQNEGENGKPLSKSTAGNSGSSRGSVIISGNKE